MKVKVFLTIVLVICFLPLNVFGAESGNSAIKAKLQKLEEMKKQSLMSEAEYKDARMKLILGSVDNEQPESKVEQADTNKIGREEEVLPKSIVEPISVPEELEPEPKPKPKIKVSKSKPEKTLRHSDEEIDSFSPAWRSAILPGWGQSYNGEKTKGIIYGGLTIGLFIGGWSTYYMAEGAANDYLTLGAGLSPTQYDDKYSKWESAANLNHTVDIVFGIAYAWTIIDAVVFARSPQSRGQGRIKLSPSKIEVALLQTTF